MEKIKKQIKQLADDLLFDMPEEDINEICNEFQSIEKQLKSINNISVVGVQPTNFSIEFEATPFREDVIREEKDANPFSNCKLVKDQYVVIKNEK